MALVALPDSLQQPGVTSKGVQDALYAHHVEVPVKTVRGRLYVRISCAVYNVLEDYEALANCLKFFDATHQASCSPS